MKLWHIIALVLLIPLAWFAYYAISPLFITVVVDDALPGSIMEENSEEEGPTPIATSSPTPSATPAPSPAQATPEPAPAPSRAAVVGTAGHPASGFVRIIEADGKTYVRYEDYKTINGPDLYVYLAKDLSAKEFVSLGLIRGTEGNINYEVPVGVRVEDYPYVLTWCKAFGVLFNSAKIN